MSEEQQEFKVTDKRGFSEDGTPRPDGAGGKGIDKKAEDGAAAAGAAQAAPNRERPSIDFPSYILGLYTQVMVMLGEVPNPVTNKKEEDVEAARHGIDLLSMLEEKTKGNLTGEEGQFLGQALYELRMKFMAKTSGIKL
ncbi:MAG: DUF1844 domain-containing protein [Acidobacteriota bacterium]|jgi:hypothetical protein|nr:DUF1844 domain-containing protein [Acidobacteriota bacterium]